MKRILYVLALLSATILVSCEKSSGGGVGGGGGGGGGTSGGGTTVAGSRPETDQTPRWWAGVSNSDLYGYIDASGKMVIEPQFSGTTDFSSGVACVAKSDGEKFYIDKDGKSLGTIPSNFSYASTSFYYNRVIFENTSNNRYGKLDLSLNVAVPEKYTNIGISGDNGYSWCTTDGNLYGYVDQEGKEVIPMQYVFCSTFFSGVTCVGVEQNGDTMYAIIDEKGDYIVAPQAVVLDYLTDGVFAYNVNGYYGLWDKKGNKLTEASYEYFLDYRDGLACFLKDGKYGFVNTKGEEIIPAMYYNCSDFSGGYCWALEAEGEPWKLIDKKGNVVHTFSLSETLGALRNGVTLVYEWLDASANLVELRYVDAKGKVIYKWTTVYTSSSAPKRMLQHETRRVPRDNKYSTKK